MVSAAFREKVKDKKHEQLTEICFQASQEVMIKTFEKTGQRVPKRRALATENFKQKVAKKTHEEMIELCYEVCEKMKAQQKKEEVTDTGKEEQPTQQPTKVQRKRRVLPVPGTITRHENTIQDMPLYYVSAFRRVAQEYEKRYLQQCRDPPKDYEVAIQDFENFVRAICTELPRQNPQDPEWDKAYGDAYTKQQEYLNNLSKNQPDAVENLRKWFAPGVAGPSTPWRSPSRQVVADWMIDYYGELLRQRCEDGAGEAYRKAFHDRSSSSSS
jgi:hypothetical protein